MFRPILGFGLVFVLSAALLLFLFLPLQPAAEEAAPAAPLPSPDIPEGFLMLDEATGDIISIGVEDFVVAAVALEMDPDAPREALKAQAIAVRSYYECLRRQYIAEEYHFTCNTDEAIVYAPEGYFQELWGDELEENFDSIEKAVKDTEAMVLEYEGQVAWAPYHPVSCGVTVAGEGFPYLMSVASPYDSLSPYFEDEKSFTPEEVMEICKRTWPKGRFDFERPYEEWFTDIIFSTGTVVYSTDICGFGVTGQEVRKAFELQSAAFQVEYVDGNFVFHTRGMGHGVGMSQHGAIQMAAMGAGCEEILAWYYPGTVLAGG